MTTLGNMIDLILARYFEDKETSDGNLDRRVVSRYVIDSVNELFFVTRPEKSFLRERRVDAAAIASYEVEVLAYGPGEESLSTSFIPISDSAQVWATANEELWSTADGEVWSTGQIGSGVPATVSFTPVASGSFTQFRVLITGFDLLPGYTLSQLNSLLTSFDQDAFIELSLESVGSTPNVFFMGGMSDISITFDSEDQVYQIFFLYTLGQASQSKSIIKDPVEVSEGRMTFTEYQLFSVSLLAIVKSEFSSDSADNLGRAVLPVQPIRDSRDGGVYEITPAGNPFSPYIPIQAHLIGALVSRAGGSLQSILGSQTGYSWHQNNEILFTRKVSDLPDKVVMKLLVVDPDKIGENDLLPVPSDMRFKVMERVLGFLALQGSDDKVIDQDHDS